MRCALDTAADSCRQFEGGNGFTPWTWKRSVAAHGTQKGIVFGGERVDDGNRDHLWVQMSGSPRDTMQASGEQIDTPVHPRFDQAKTPDGSGRYT